MGSTLPRREKILTFIMIIRDSNYNLDLAFWNISSNEALFLKKTFLVVTNISFKIKLHLERTQKEDFKQPGYGLDGLSVQGGKGGEDN